MYIEELPKFNFISFGFLNFSMRNFQKESLFQLIKSLSKSEKRQFKLYANRLQSNSDTKFIALFNMLAKMNDYDEQKILQSKSFYINL